MATAKEIYRYRPSLDDIAQVLSMRLSAAIGTLNEDGSIHLAYVIFLHEDGRLYVETSSVTRKARNVTSRPQATFLVQGLGSSGRNLMVAGEGAARVIGGAEAQGLNRRLRAKYLVESARDPIERAWGKIDDVTLELTPTRWRSWTGTLLHEEAVKELGGSYADAWIPDDD